MVLAFVAAAFMATPVLDKNGRIPIPPEKDWPKFQGHAPIEKPSESYMGFERWWLYSFRGNWKEVVTKAKADLPKQGFNIREHDKSVWFGRGEPDGMTASVPSITTTSLSIGIGGRFQTMQTGPDVKQSAGSLRFE